MRYMLLVCGDESATFEPDGEIRAESAAWVAEMEGRGMHESGSRLRPTTDATTVRIRDDEVVITDGPFAETKEQILGYDFIKCADLDEAIAVVSKHPMARFGTIEIRPIWPE